MTVDIYKFFMTKNHRTILGFLLKSTSLQIDKFTMYKIIILFTLSPLIRSCNAAVLFQAAFLGWLDPRDMQLPTPPTLPWVRVCFPRHQDIPPISTGDHLALFPVHTRRLSPRPCQVKTQECLPLANNFTNNC